MTDFLKAKRALTNAIHLWAQRSGQGALDRWREIEDAILALDNAAYARAHQEADATVQALYKTPLGQVEREFAELQRQFDERGRERDGLMAQRDRHLLERDLARDERKHVEKARDRLTRSLAYVQGCAKRGYQLAKDRAMEIEYLRAERDGARRDATTMTLANDDKRQLLRRIRPERDGLQRELVYRKGCARDWHQTAIDRAQEIERLQAELADARETICKWAGGIPIIEAQNTTKNLRSLANGEMARGVRLTKALETLADRYHHELCFGTNHSRQECSAPPGAVRDAEEALGGDLKPFKTDDEQLNEAERQRGACLKSAGVVTGGDVESGTLQEFAGYYRLRKAFETLADRYHAQMCYKSRRAPHAREDCACVLAVQDANAALVGESEEKAAMCCGPEHQYAPAPCQIVCPGATPGPGQLHHSFSVNPGGAGNTYVVNACTKCRISREAARAQPDSAPIAVIRDDRNPDIEAVLVGNLATVCAGGCGRSVQRGNVMYRQVRQEPAHRSLYATRECALRARLEADRPLSEPARCRCVLHQDQS